MCTICEWCRVYCMRWPCARVLPARMKRQLIRSRFVLCECKHQQHPKLAHFEPTPLPHTLEAGTRIFTYMLEKLAGTLICSTRWSVFRVLCCELFDSCLECVHTRPATIRNVRILSSSGRRKNHECLGWSGWWDRAFAHTHEHTGTLTMRLVIVAWHAVIYAISNYFVRRRTADAAAVSPSGLCRHSECG